MKLLIALGILIAIGTGRGTGEGWGASRKFFSLGVGNAAGTFYFIGAGFANIFNKYVPKVRGIAESTASSEESFHLILRKRMDMAPISINVIE
jgi:TRAP-type uncharacterized transport system substrate-binding protein